MTRPSARVRMPRARRRDPGGQHVVHSTTGARLRWLAGVVSDARHVGEPGVLPLERDGDLVGGAVAVLRDDEVGLAGARWSRSLGRLAVQQDDDVGILLEGSGLTQVRERGLLVGTCSGPRLSCASATMGMPSSLASSFERRENSLTSCCRDSTFLPLVMSCR